MSHTLTINDRRISSGELKAVDDAPPKMTDWWADFGLGDRGLIRPSASPEKRVETSGMFFLQEISEDLKSRPQHRAMVEAQKAPKVLMIPPGVLPSDSALETANRNVWALPALLGALVLVASLSALGTLVLTGRAGRTVPIAVAAAPAVSPGRAVTSLTVVPAVKAPSARKAVTRPSATPMAPPPGAPVPAAIIAAPAPLDQPAMTPAVKEDRDSKRKRRRRSKRSRKASDRDADEATPGPTTSSYSLYATLGAVNTKKAAPQPVAPALQKSGGIATEALKQVRPKARPSDTYRMLKVAASGESAKPVARPKLPSRLPASAVTRAFGRVQSGVRACLRRFGFNHATIRLRITVSGATGRVSAAHALGRFGGSPAGRCALRRVQGLRFPRFSSPSQIVLLPVRTR